MGAASKTRGRCAKERQSKIKRRCKGNEDGESLQEIFRPSEEVPDLRGGDSEAGLYILINQS
jgi:hypothetical protein